MSKQGLGRGLGSLMGSAAKGETGQAPVSLGVRTLMRETKPEPAPLEAAPKPAPVPAPTPAPLCAPVAEPRSIVPRWYLFAGDVLLVAMAIATVCLSPRPLSWQREVFCAALVVVAAILAVVAIASPAAKD